MAKSIFSPEAISKLVDETLPKDVRPGEHVLVGTVDRNGAAALVTFGFDNGWSIKGVARMEWGGDLQAGATVIKRF